MKKIFNILAIVAIGMIVANSFYGNEVKAETANQVSSQTILDDTISPLPSKKSSDLRTLDKYQQEIIEEAKEISTNQQIEQNYDLPVSKINYKILFISLENITATDLETGKTTYYVMTSEEKQIVKQTVRETENYLNKNIPNVNFTIDLVSVNQNFHSTTPYKVISGHQLWHENAQFKDYLKRNVAHGAYDAIVTGNSGTSSGGGFTVGSYGFLQGASYLNVGITLRVDTTPIYSSMIFLHELCHVLTGFPIDTDKGNVHKAVDYGYRYSEKLEWSPFYKDLLTGKLKDTAKVNPKTTGKYIGIFPRTWQLTPRFVNAPSKIEVEYVDEKGKRIAPTNSFYGPGGDRYEISQILINGYKLIGISGDNEKGILETGKVKKIIYRYKKNTFGQVMMGFLPNQQADQLVDLMNQITIPLNYKNRNDSPWFDLLVKENVENVDLTKIITSDSKILKYEQRTDGILRFRPLKVGTVEITIPNKDGTQKYTKRVVIKPAIKDAFLTYTPNKKDIAIDNIPLEVSSNYKNRGGNGLINIRFKTGNDEIDINKVTSSNSKVVQYDASSKDGLHRFWIKGTGTAELKFPSKTGNYTYTKQVVVKPAIKDAYLTYTPNKKDIAIDDIPLEVSSDYKNRGGNRLINIRFKTGNNEIDINKVTSSNSKVVQYDASSKDGLHRFWIKGTGTAELKFPSKTGNYTYTKQVVIKP
ncbi:MucBP domain-containing protein [Enterococcus termitis]|uniref:MucBP domain-containing protein n=1 Tax=Enterococcus termitis TaxID=332950 RepID=UPI0009003CB4|nr:MucBP domain-containing protein [Enterococcus termitis]OJG98325.1 hypothetical protein RV18_GL003226 [Enterococcus termitis]